MRQSRGLARARPLVLVAVGGFVGAISRHAVSVSAPAGEWGTLAVNVVGSFLLGAVLAEAHLSAALSTETRLVLGTGFLSSFTTYSTFAVQTASLSPAFAALNVGANYGLAILAVLAGQAVARWSS